MKLFLIPISILLFSYSVFSFEISRVEVNCPNQSRDCSQLKDIFKAAKRTYDDQAHFVQILKIFVGSEGISKFSYKVFKSKGGGNKLEVSAALKDVVNEIIGPRFTDTKFRVDFPLVLPIKVAEYLGQAEIDATKRLLKEICRDQGFPKAKVLIKNKKTEQGAQVKIDVRLGKPILISSIVINSRSLRIKKLTEEKIGYYLKKPFAPQQIKNELEDLRGLLLQYGYYNVDFSFKNQVDRAGKVSIFLDVQNTQTTSFHLKGNHFFQEDELKEFLAGQVIALKREATAEAITQLLTDKYHKVGFRSVNLQVTKTISQNGFRDKNSHFLIKIDEGVRTFFQSIDFKGNDFFSKRELKRSFYEFATEIIEIGSIDEKYLDDFKEILRKKYIEKGFVSVFVDNAEIQENLNTKLVNINFRIREGIQTFVDKLEISGLPVNIKRKIGLDLKNMASKPFNPIALTTDLEYLQASLRNFGYYYAEIQNANDKGLIKYKQDNSKVDINIKVKLGPRLYIDKIVIIGNRKTKGALLKREISLGEGDLITQKDIETSQTNLLSLGLFSSVQIKPIGGRKGKSDIVIFVREKDFGSVELAPGIRTDIGLKLSAQINYNNIDGMNKKISFKGTVNQRFNLNALDTVRRENSNSLVEYDATTNFTENHIFYSNYDFGLVLNKSRRRFFSFDADIQRISYSVSRQFNRWLGISFRQQLETISQFEATQDRDHGFFQIGSFSPSITMDFRDRPINPTRGAQLDLAVEFANPFFLSQQNDELTINYYKLTARNRFYFPLSDSMVLALSTTFGIQENGATSTNENGDREGYIPGIKVFRLIGADMIRGFEDDEMNRLESGQDISAVAVDSRAYMFNLKFEPRYFVSDSTVLGIFYDAGRVFVNEFQPNNLRSAVGLSFKYLTPVGTLDFNYGIKLLRKRYSDGTLESPGRLHVSIGFF